MAWTKTKRWQYSQPGPRDLQPRFIQTKAFKDQLNSILADYSDRQRMLMREECRRNAVSYFYAVRDWNAPTATEKMKSLVELVDDARQLRERLAGAAGNAEHIDGAYRQFDAEGLGSYSDEYPSHALPMSIRVRVHRDLRELEEVCDIVHERLAAQKLSDAKRSRSTEKRNPKTVLATSTAASYSLVLKEMPTGTRAPRSTYIQLLALMLEHCTSKEPTDDDLRNYAKRAFDQNQRG